MNKIVAAPQADSAVEVGSPVDDKITVLNPVGYPPKVNKKAAAPRPESLDGKTIYLVDCRFDDSIELLKQVQAWFAEHMPSVKTKIDLAVGDLSARRSRRPGKRSRRTAMPPSSASAIAAPARRRSPPTRSRSRPNTACRRSRCTPTSSTASCSR